MLRVFWLVADVFSPCWLPKIQTLLPRPQLFEPLGQVQTHALFFEWNHNKKSCIISACNSMKNIRLRFNFVPYILLSACEVASHGRS